MPASELAVEFHSDDRLVLFRRHVDADGSARYRAMRVEWSLVAAVFEAEAKARAAADKGLSSRLTAIEGRLLPFSAALAIPAGASILVGKTIRTVAIPALKKGDGLVVQPNAPLPASVTMTEVQCLKDGELNITLVNTAALALSVTAALSIPLGGLAIRPVS